MKFKPLTILDRYIIKKFLGTYIFSIVLIISIAVVFDINEKMDKFINNDAPLQAIVMDYYMNFIPYFANLFSPLFVFISVIFFTSKLAENSEIIAMFSTGMSFKRLMRPYMISAAFIALLSFGLSSYVIPKGSSVRLNFEDTYIKKRKVNQVRNVQLEVAPGVIAYIDRYEDSEKRGYRFSLDKFEDKKLVSHLTARNITYDTLSQHRWTIRDYMIREMGDLKENITSGTKMDTTINMEPSDFFLLSQEVSNDFKAYAVVATKFFLFSPSFPTSFDLHFYILRHPTMKLPAESMTHLVQLFEMLQAKEAEASEEPGFHFMPDSFSHQITSQLAKIFCLEIYNHYRKALPFGKQGIKSSTKENIVLRFLQLLRSNVEKERRISFYSNALDITPQYLATILKKVTGLSTNQWMHILVIERAKHLLLTENKSIQEVARILNYPDQSTFGKMFKVETGLSPIQFKKEISN